MADVRPSNPDDWSRIAAISSAGFNDDPLMTWVFPEAATRREKLRTLFSGLALDMVGEQGVAFVGEDACTALWRAPGFDHGGSDEPDDADPATAAPPPFAEEELERLARLTAAMHEHHPHEPHWYLNVLATDPNRQGQGLGAATLQPVLRTCDDQQIPAYLESSNPRNLTLYRRQGFRETGEIRLPDGPSLTPMWRDPR